MLGKKIGDVLEVNTKNMCSSWGHWLKVRALVYVSKRLAQGCWLNIAARQRVWVTFK